MQANASVERSSPYCTPEHAAFRDTVRRFVAKEIEPYASQWDEAGEFPRELYKKAAAAGPLQLRIYRELKVNAIGVGTEEIMKDLAARQLGW